MQYLDQQLAEFKAEFAKRRRRQLLAVIPILAIFVLRIVLGEKKPEAAPFGLTPEILVGAALVVVLGVIAFSLWNWRCPACNKYLGKGIGPAFCAKCGAWWRRRTAASRSRASDSPDTCSAWPMKREPDTRNSTSPPSPIER